MRWLGTLSLLFAFSVLGNEPASLLDFELRSLSAPERHTLEQYQGAPMLMMFFEPECSWCARQFRVLDKLQAECEGSFNPIAVGINGSRRELLEEYRKQSPAIPTYQASSRLVAVVGGVPATPFTLVADAQGQPLGWLRGYMSEEKLRVIVEQQLGENCVTST